MMLKSLLALGLVGAFSLGAHAQSAEPKADLIFFSDADQEMGLAEYWTAQGFRVHVVDAGSIIEPSVGKVLVAGAYRAAHLAIEFTNRNSKLVAGLILIEPEISGAEELAPRIPVLVERIDHLNPLKLWTERQIRQGKNVQDVGFFGSEEMNEKLGRRLTVDFMNAALAGSLKRVVP